MNVYDFFNVATATMTEVITGLTDQSRHARTANPERDGVQLLKHVFDVNGSAKANAAGIDVTTGFAPDPIGEDVLASYHASAASTRAAFADPILQTVSMPTPMGLFPGRVVLTVTSLENLIHAWDLSIATGRPVEFDAVAVGYAFRALEDIPIVANTFREWRSWAPPLIPPANATPTTRLLNFFGRDPHQPFA